MDGVLLTRVDERCVQRLYGGSQSGGRGCRRGGRRLGATAALPTAALHRGRCQRWGATAAVSRGAPPRAMRGRRRRWMRRTRGAVGRSVRGACHLARLGLAPLCVPPPRWSAPPPAPWQQPSRTAVGSGDPRPTDGTCAASAVLDAAPDDQTTGACSKPPHAHGGPCEDGSGWSRPAPPGAVRCPMGPPGAAPPPPPFTADAQAGGGGATPQPAPVAPPSLTLRVPRASFTRPPTPFGLRAGRTVVCALKRRWARLEHPPRPRRSATGQHHPRHP